MKTFFTPINLPLPPKPEDLLIRLLAPMRTAGFMPENALDEMPQPAEPDTDAFINSPS